MTDTAPRRAVETLPLPPLSPMPLRQTMKTLRSFHTGPEVFRDLGGPVVRIKLAPSWLAPEMVVVTSPQGAHDVLGTSDAIVERNKLHHEMRRMIGANLFDVPHDEWLPRRRLLQPLFTKKHVRDYGGSDVRGGRDHRRKLGSE